MVSAVPAAEKKRGGGADPLLSLFPPDKYIRRHGVPPLRKRLGVVPVTETKVL